MGCPCWYCSSLWEKMVCSPAVSCSPHSASILYLGAGCGWGQNHQGWFCSLEFPRGCCVHLLSIAAEKHSIQQLFLLRADLKCWTLLLGTQFCVIVVMYHDLVEHQAHLSSQSIWTRHFRNIFEGMLCSIGLLILLGPLQLRKFCDSMITAHFVGFCWEVFCVSCIFRRLKHSV